MPRHSKTANQSNQATFSDPQDMLRNAPIGVFTSTPEDRFVSANQALAGMLGYDSPEELIKSVTDIAEQLYVDPADREEITRLLEKKGRVSNHEVRLRRKDGSIIWTSRSVRAVREEMGRIIHYQGFVADITRPRQTEEALQKTMSMFECTSRMARIGWWGKNLLTGEDEWSDVTREIHEVGPDFVPTMENSVNFYKQGESRQKIMDVVTRCVETGEPYDVELEFITARGNEIWIRTMGQAELQDGRCVRLFGNFQDITERKRAEEALRESEARFKALHNASFGGIGIHDKGLILECNQGLSKITGFEYEELIGMDGLLLIAEKSREAVMNNILSGYEKPYEAIGLRKNGEEYPIRLEARNIPYKGKMVRVAEFRDITEHKRMQAQLLQAHKMESVGVLAGGIAHDFNNLLHVMGGNLELLDMKLPEDHPGKKRARTIRKSMDRAAQLVRQMLLFSRKVEARRRELDLNQEIQQAAEMLERTIPKMISIELDLDKEARFINADPIQVEQVLLTLATNATDAMPDGGRLIIETRNADVDEALANELTGLKKGGYVLMNVSDSGCGMDPDTLKNVFEPFFTTKETGKGTGLGLASVYGIVKAHGGYISCESQPGKGTTFKIYWPAVNTKLDND